MTRRQLIAATGCCTPTLLERAAGGDPPATRRPRIGIAAASDDNYARAIELAGGTAETLAAADHSPAHIDGLLARLDGLLLPGGADIPPAEYGEPAHPSVKLLEPERCAFQRALGGAWLGRTAKPLLGICLGCQWLNVLRGGSLVQDIPSEFGVSHRDTRHLVAIERGSRLHTILGAAQLEVNSFHHQAARRLGRGLRATARCPDGLVEALEDPAAGRFILGVQWHPERAVPAEPAQLRLFEAFVAACLR